MVIEYIRYEVEAARAAAFLAAYAQAAEELQASPHCLGHEVSQGIEEPTHFVVRIEWTSVHDHEEGFRKSAAFASFLAKVKPFFADIREMKHHERRSGGGRG